jgi:drug/metabolite transporter (DMT)-like permease
MPATEPAAPLLQTGIAQWSHAMQARAGLGVVAAAYGSNYACVKLMDGWVGAPAQAALLRFAVAALVALPMLAHFSRTRADLVSWPVARDGLSVGLLFGVGCMVQAIALQTSAASLQAFLCSLSVIVCPLLDQIIGGNNQPPRVWGAAMIAVLGVACLECGNVGTASLAPGDVLGLLQPLLFGGGFWLCEQAIHRHRTIQHDMALPMVLTCWNLVAVLGVATVWFAVDSAATGSGGVQQLQRLVGTVVSAPMEHVALLAALFWTGLVTTAGCSFAEAGALGEISSADAMVVFSTEPLWGAFFAWLMIGEEIGPATAAGGLLMVLACIVSGGGAKKALAAAEAQVPAGKGD